MSYSSEIAEKTCRIYSNLEKIQSDWYKKSNFLCPSGCGCCCHNFEPDLLECEAIFMASWLIENKYETAISLAQEKFAPEYPVFTEKTCIFYNNDSDYHCSIYGGRPFICRLFGASSTKNKDEEIVWRPCKFYPLEKLQEYNKILDHKTYSASDTKKILKKCPPVMSDIMEQALSITPGNTQTFPLREILPKTIRKLLLEKQFSEN